MGASASPAAGGASAGSPASSCARAGPAASNAVSATAAAATLLLARLAIRPGLGVHGDVEAQLVAALLLALPFVGDVAVVLRLAADDHVLAARRDDDEARLDRAGEPLVVLAGGLDAHGDDVAAGGDEAVPAWRLVLRDRPAGVVVDAGAVEAHRRARHAVEAAAAVVEVDAHAARVDRAGDG